MLFALLIFLFTVSGCSPGISINKTPVITSINQDGDALPLVNGHNYSWHCWNSGYDENGYRIAVSESIDWHFDYTGP